MKNASPALIAFLATAQRAAKADLYTITLSGGTVIRWTDADKLVSVPGGFTFVRGPLINDSGTRQKRGLKVDGINITVDARDSDTIGGVPLIEFIRLNGLDGATFLIERAFMADWESPIIGTYIRFKGRFSKVTDLSEMSATVAVAAWTELLNVNMPSDVYLTPCQNVLGDSACQVDLESYKVGGTVSSIVNSSLFDTDVGGATGTYSLGKILFRTGPNAGLKRTVKMFTSGGLVQTIIGFPANPGIGDLFWIYPGCSLSMANCVTPFNNLIHFRGEPFIPEASTAA